VCANLFCHIADQATSGFCMCTHKAKGPQVAGGFDPEERSTDLDACFFRPSVRILHPETFLAFALRASALTGKVIHVFGSWLREDKENMAAWVDSWLFAGQWACGGGLVSGYCTSVLGSIVFGVVVRGPGGEGRNFISCVCRCVPERTRSDSKWVLFGLMAEAEDLPMVFGLV
jgi:hypothetical protein